LLSRAARQLLLGDRVEQQAADALTTPRGISATPGSIMPPPPAPTTVPSSTATIHPSHPRGSTISAAIRSTV
jgi:hypothetical protein